MSKVKPLNKNLTIMQIIEGKDLGNQTLLELQEYFSGDELVRSRKVHFLVALIDGEFVLKRAIESQNISKSAHYTWLKSDEAYRSLFEYLSSVRTRIAIDNMVDAVIEDASGNALISTNILARTKNEILDPLGLVNVNQIKTASSGSNTNIQIVVDLGDK